MNKPIGTIHPERTLFLRQSVGETVSDDNKYEISIAVDGSPIVHSKTTGKWFTLSWTDVLRLADEAGISEKENIENENPLD